MTKTSSDDSGYLARKSHVEGPRAPVFCRLAGCSGFGQGFNVETLGLKIRV